MLKPSSDVPAADEQKWRQRPRVDTVDGGAALMTETQETTCRRLRGSAAEGRGKRLGGSSRA